ncbi:MAG: S41 family peptidase [Bacteroidota bacterium]
MENKETKPNNSERVVKLPIIISLSLAAGLFIGATLFGGQLRLGSLIKGYNKYKEVLSLIESSYVDSVDTDTLVDFSIRKMLEKLDPHTSYFSASEATFARSPLEAGFDGIGVEFNIYQDTVVVVSPLSGGPSEAAGIQSGDKILKADSIVLTGPKLNSELIFKALRGKQGSEVKLSIKRNSQKKPLSFLIKRDRIPSFSVSAGYLLDAKTGLIKVDRFSETTFKEFKTTLKSLKNQGMKQLILDLRGNPGGYMDRATDMVDEFLEGKKLIVYTDGKGTQYDKKTYSGNQGIFEEGSVVVLVDEGSASASEIVAGSLQDNDRALIVGRRSFGKGLVQMPVNLSDGSEIRLTISRYYTPSGRCVQKPYTLGDEEGYEKDYEARLKSGEFFNADSIHNNKNQKFKTAKGRIVYGGGGVTPDVFVSRDTSYYSPMLYDIWGRSTIRTYAMEFVKNNKATLNNYNFGSFAKGFEITEKMYADLLNMAKKDGVKVTDKDQNLSKKYIQLQAKASIARYHFQKRTNENGLNNEYNQIMGSADEVIKKAQGQFEAARLLAEK